MHDWLLVRVDPAIYDAVQRAADDGWVQRADWLRAAVVEKLRAEGRLPPRRAHEMNAARTQEAA